MEFGAVVEIILVLLAAVGVACLGKYISEAFFAPRELVSAIKIIDDTARDNIDILLHISKKSVWRWVGRETCVLISEKYENDEELMALIDQSGMQYFIIYGKGEKNDGLEDCS